MPKGKEKIGFGGFLREIVFGFEDGLISALGVIAGISGAALGNYFIILAVVVEMFAGGISMGAGTYLSLKTEREYFETELKKRKIKKVHKREFAPFEEELRNPLKGASIMFVTFILASVVPVVPYVLSLPTSLNVSIVLTVGGLFAFGAYKTVYTKRNPIRSGLEMVIVGMLAAAVGYQIGLLFKV